MAAAAERKKAADYKAKLEKEAAEWASKKAELEKEEKEAEQAK